MTIPSIALVLGDPAGVGPELVAKVLSKEENRNKANIAIIADRDELEKGMAIAGLRFPYEEADDIAKVTFKPGVPVLFHHKNSHPAPFEYGVATEQSGVYMLETLKKAVDMTQAGYTSGICFAPLNKQAMHKGGLKYRDELHWFAELTDFRDFACELNVVDGIWASRVTSHIPFKDIVANLSVDSVLDCIELLQRTLLQAGVAKPKIAVQALNPHGGEGGLFGDEEIKIIKPAMEKAREKGIDVYGPFPADTTLKAVQDMKLDGVVSMYHDQFASALKMLGFERGVTVQGGIPIPIATANHGTAYNIYGQNVASPLAYENALNITINMAKNAR
ncbi:4-hydroxythreonine-4-phosphate dehydrogenase PdxA [Leminorella grimontii]|nr:4-hydroxythreonine-4-phosphate dehydrogenase PdxA [Leminorella grimontii]KFC94972.1 4-hydroxythreonine-4-phosphate dehydrogenase [Leminorella grimontii ATCC 33999 = DSM 5078]VFS61195.1 4-hydroxythreonine-4-phosphate dehydrogenase 2 [Leminorella grimontii]